MGEWKTNRERPRRYKELYDTYSKSLKIKFTKGTRIIKNPVNSTLLKALKILCTIYFVLHKNIRFVNNKIYKIRYILKIKNIIQ